MLINGDIGRLDEKTSLNPGDSLSLFRDGALYRVDGAKISSLLSVSSVNEDTSLDLSYSVVLADATAGSLTITLPTASSSTDKVFSIKRTNTAGGDVVIDGNGPETIDKATTQTLTGSQRPSLTVVSDGTEWWII